MTQPTHAEEEFFRVQNTQRFRDLRAAQHRFVFPMAAVFLLWYLAFVIVAAFAPQFMAIKVWGNINIGLIWGVLQFVSTFLITMAYVSFANKKLDPVATAIREELEAQGIGLPEDTAQEAEEAAVMAELQEGE